MISGRLFILVILWFGCTMGSQGLELSLDRDIQVSHGSRVMCGVLRCLEENNIYSDSSTMEIFRSDKTSSSTSKDMLLAALNPQQPSITRVANGIKVDGLLEVGRATLRLELYKQEECESEFTCKFRTVDNEGNTLVSSTHLVQQEPGYRMSPLDGGTVASGLPLHMLLVVQKLLDKTESLEARLMDKLSSFKKEIECSVTGTIADKLGALDVKISEMLRDISHLGNKGEASDKTFTVIHHERPEELNVCSKFSKMNERLGDSLKNITSYVNELQENITEQRLLENGNKMTIEQTQEHLNETLHSVQLATTNIHNKLEDLKNKVDAKFDQLEADLTRSAEETRLTNLQVHNETSASVTIGLKAVLRDLLAPKSCRKGIISLPPQTPFPYTVIHPSENSDLSIPYLCDTVTDGGGWVIIQRRTNDEGNFYRGWQDYKKGFGSLDGNFWLGNEYIQALSSQGKYELRVDLRNVNGEAAFAHYNEFSIADEKSKYTLTLGSYSGTAGDSMTRHHGRAFTTFDNDNDKNPSGNCAIIRRGAWWYDYCNDSNLNGNWENHANHWGDLFDVVPMAYSEMKIRRVDAE